ncbi:MAG: hypothetical protein IT443_02825 [Phycisphaeraceae bacterium]|nr:hypothetical protein [Phycisphaeraceae bacterium]
MSLHTPMALIIFNRPDLAGQALVRIARARPSRLLVIADGPRKDRPGEAELCDQTRALLDKVDWPCQIDRNFSPVNMGCGKRIASGLDWVFAQVEEAIILEDDCVPEDSFFPYCQELLRHYRDDQRVMCVSGDNFQHGRERTPYSYYFSRYAHIWGWATWRRAWRHFDHAMTSWPTFRDSGMMRQILEAPAEQDYWTNIYNRMHAGTHDVWSYMWQYAIWSQGGLTACPRVNLVSNVGFRGDGTHTQAVDGAVAGLPTLPLKDIVHPPFVVRHREADQYCFENIFTRKAPAAVPAGAWLSAGWRTLRRILPRVASPRSMPQAHLEAGR